MIAFEKWQIDQSILNEVLDAPNVPKINIISDIQIQPPSIANQNNQDDL